MKLRKSAKWALPTALEHAGADARCGRQWVCACAACNITRAESEHQRSIRRGSYDKNMHFVTDIETAIAKERKF